MGKEEQNNGDQSQISSYQVWGRKMNVKEHRGTFGGGLFCILIIAVVMALDTFVKTCGTAPLKAIPKKGELGELYCI